MSTNHQDLSFLRKVTAVSVQCGNLSFSKKLPKGAVTTASDPERVSASKRLLDCPEANAISTEFRRLKAFIQERTLPTPFGKGVYFVPNSRLEEIDIELQAAKQINLPRLGESLIAVFDATLESERAALGSNFNLGDYDTPAEIRERLGVEYAYLTFGIPENLPNNILAREAENQRQRLVESVDAMQTLLRNEMADLVKHAAETLAGTKEGGKPKTFKNTLVQNIRDFLALFNDRNITDDAEMAAICARASELLDGINPQDLRDQAPLRQSVAAGFAAIRADLDAMMVPRGNRVITFEDEPAAAEPEPLAA